MYSDPNVTVRQFSSLKMLILQVILSGTYTEAHGKVWHKHHFVCCMCDQQLHDKLHKVEDEVFCAACYDKHRAVHCHMCKTPIGIGQVKVSLRNGRTMHTECFVCRKCKTNLSGTKYYTSNEDLLCHECFSRQPAAQCLGCKNAISSTVSFLRHKQHCWHAECFKCTICQAWLADGEFHEMDDNIICRECFLKKTSRKCCKCQESIITKEIKLGYNAYHPECFSCTDCDKSLTGETKVKDNNGQPICSDCYQKLTKKCFNCRGPIITRYTVYKGKPFHIECFKCNLCGSSIDGSDFFETSLNEVLCSKCGSLQ